MLEFFTSTTFQTVLSALNSGFLKTLQLFFVTLIGALPKILIYAPFWFLRMDGRARLVVWMMLIMGGGNVVLDLVFLYPLGMGIGGAAWASVISTAAACAFGLVCLCGRRSSFASSAEE